MRSLSVLLVIFLLSAGNSFAQNKIISNDTIVLVENVLKKVGKNTNFTIVPGPVTGVSQKVGFAVLPMLFYDLNKKDTISPPSSSAILVYFDFYGSWVVAFKQSFYWNQNKWRAFIGGGYGDLRLKFFGVGRDTVIIGNHDTNFIWTRMRAWDFSATCFRKIYKGLYGGLEYRYSLTDLDGDDSLGTATIEKSGVSSEEISESILIPTFIWDNRDNIFWSVQGYYATLCFQVANNLIGSSRNYGVFSGSVNGYHRMIRNSNKMILAWRFYTQAGWGDLPYLRYSIYGRSDDVTGYTRGKYVNSSESSIQAELRYEVWKFISCGGYIGTGKVYPSLEVFGQSVWLHFGGLRVYANVIPSRNIRLKLDLAVARKDWGFYIGIGQAF